MEQAKSTNRRKPSSTVVTKRKVVEIAKDVDIVLMKCRKLRDELRSKAEKIATAAVESAAFNVTSLLDSDGDDEIDDDNDKKVKAKVKIDDNNSDDDNNNVLVSKKDIITLPDGTSTSMNDIIEVAELSVTEVLNGLEMIAVNITEQVINHNGIHMMIPSRSSTNQIYMKEWDRIVLGNKKLLRSYMNIKECRKTAITVRVIQLIHAVLMKRIHITKRDLFYTDAKLFVDQNESDHVLDDVATMIGCTRSNLHVVASEKGLVVGRIQFVEDGDEIDCTKMGVSGKAIPPYIDKIENIRSDAEFILLVEKEAAYMRMAEDRFYHKYPCIVITAKGQPDVATRLFLSRITYELQIPVLGLVDSDPYGLKILSVYMSGSKNMSYDSLSLTTPNIQWLGIRPSDFDKYHLPDQCRLDMTDADIKIGKELLKEDFIIKNPAWYKELELMLKMKQKAEIQSLSSFGFQYITETYLPRKLKEGDWI